MEHVEDLQSWLVDSEHYSSIRSSQSIEVSQELSRGGSIKTYPSKGWNKNIKKCVVIHN